MHRPFTRKKLRQTPTNADLAIGAVAGFFGGLLGSWVMNQTHGLLSKLKPAGSASDSDESKSRRAPQQPVAASAAACTTEAAAIPGAHAASAVDQEMNGPFREEGEGSQPEPRSEQDESASESSTVQTAQGISQHVFGHELSEKRQEAAGSAVHYGYGAMMGGLYGTLAEIKPEVTTGAGTMYASALWLIGDEIAIPALRLGPAPHRTPLSTHADALLAHLVYGLTTEFTRRGLKTLFHRPAARPRRFRF